MNKQTQIIWRKIDDLIPYDYNTKEHTPEQIEKLRLSFERYGWQNAVMIDTDDVIIYGHGRCLGAKAAGLTEAPTIVCDDLTDEQIREYRIADNMLQEGGYIETALMHELPLVDLEEFEFDFGLEIEGEIETEIIEDTEPEQAEPRCKLGDVWQLGNHKLICGDSTDAAVIERLMDGEKADLLLTDPPYNLDYTGKTKEELKIDNDNFESVQSFIEFLKSALSNANSSLKRGGIVLYLARTHGKRCFL